MAILLKPLLLISFGIWMDLHSAGKPEAEGSNPVENLRSLLEAAAQS
jgi:hypothetical protein